MQFLTNQGIDDDWMSTDNWLPDLMELNPNPNWNMMPPLSSISCLEEDHSLTRGSHSTEAQPLTPTFPIQEIQLQNQIFELDTLVKYPFESSNGTLPVCQFIHYFFFFHKNKILHMYVVHVTYNILSNKSLRHKKKINQ